MELLINVGIVVIGGLFVLSVALEWLFNATLMDVVRAPLGARLLRYLVIALGLFAVFATVFG